MADDQPDNIVPLPGCEVGAEGEPVPCDEDTAWHWQLAMRFVSEMPVGHEDAMRVLDHARELHRKYLAR